MANFVNNKSLSPEEKKDYLNELFIQAVANKTKPLGEQTDLRSIAASFGRTSISASKDIQQIQKMMDAIEIYISNAVDDNKI